ncbi:MAG: TetR/AcrR family transcriptional regulator [Janthinobacterium lividum]
MASSNREATQKAIHEAAVNVIAQHGFQAASLRMIAKEVGIRAPSLYNYIESKEQFLFDLLRVPLKAMADEFKAKTAGMTDPTTRLRVFVAVHLNFHLHARKEVFIGNMELRNLSKAHYKVIAGLRDDYSALLTTLIEDGVRTGAFRAEAPRVTTFAVLAMLSGVCNWYRPDGLIAAEQLVEIHTELALNMLEPITRASMQAPKPHKLAKSAKPAAKTTSGGAAAATPARRVATTRRKSAAATN